MTPGVDHLVDVVHAEYRELPGLHLTKAQICRFLGVDPVTCDVILNRLEGEHFLQHTPQGDYVLDREAAHRRTVHASC